MKPTTGTWSLHCIATPVMVKAVTLTCNNSLNYLAHWSDIFGEIRFRVSVQNFSKIQLCRLISFGVAYLGTSFMTRIKLFLLCGTLDDFIY